MVELVAASLLKKGDWFFTHDSEQDVVLELQGFDMLDRLRIRGHNGGYAFNSNEFAYRGDAEELPPVLRELRKIYLNSLDEELGELIKNKSRQMLHVVSEKDITFQSLGKGEYIAKCDGAEYRVVKKAEAYVVIGPGGVNRITDDPIELIQELT